MQLVLFLCSGNFYRSRFAEACFNYHAERGDHGWRAESRGFRLSPQNVGPISPHALAGLKQRGLWAGGDPRFPLVVTAADFTRFDHIVAVKEAEHRAKMAAQFPAWADRIEYWQIHDIDVAQPAEALPVLEEHVLRLLSRLSQHNAR